MEKIGNFEGCLIGSVKLLKINERLKISSFPIFKVMFRTFMQIFD